MKKKDIIIIIVCLIIIAIVTFFLLTTFVFKKSTTSSEQQGQTTETMDFTGDIDENAINKIKERKDYMNLPMENIGRGNPFAKF